VVVKAALYVRVSRDSQTVENQLLELRHYVAARGWTAVEYVDHAVSGSRESRPALDRLIADARRRKVDVICAWSLDRIGRNLRALVLLVDELASLNVALVTLKESLDLGSASGRLMLHVMSALAEFERSRVVERVKAGLARAKANGKRLGRQPYPIADDQFEAVAGLSLREAAAELGVSRSVVHRWRQSQRGLALHCQIRSGGFR
jgi:DNA invertase Pin-like site-specific DNA recombinase